MIKTWDSAWHRLALGLVEDLVVEPGEHTALHTRPALEHGAQVLGESRRVFKPAGVNALIDEGITPVPAVPVIVKHRAVGRLLQVSGDLPSALVGIIASLRPSETFGTRGELEAWSG